MQDERKEVAHRWKRAKKRADNFIQTFEECYEFTQPQRPSFYEEVEGERRDHRIYDSGPVTMTAEFANRMQAGLAPEGSRWAALVGGPDLSDDEKRSTRADFEAVTNTVFEAIHESNFGDALNEVLLDLSVGTGGMIVNDNKSTGRIENIPVPLPFLRIDNGPDGKVDTNFRTQRLKAEDIPVLWGDKAFVPDCMTDADGQNKEHIVRDVVYRDWTRLDAEVFKYKVFAEADKESFIFEDEFKGRGSNPWITARWSKAGGEAFGRGPVFNTLGDIKALNLTMQLIFENAEMAVTGMWQAIDDGVLNMDTIMFVPGVILPTGPNGGITPLQPGGSFDVSMLILNEMRQNIRKALYSDALGAPEGTPMSATEVAQRMAELARTVGAPLSRLWHELFVPYLERVVYLLNKRGDIDLPRINDRIVTVTAQSPLARAARNEDITQFANFAGLVGQIFGPQSTQMYLKDDKAIPQLADWYSVPASWLRNNQERQELAKQGLQAAGQAQEAGLDPNALLQGNLP
tara:strand:- start:2578 stop:4128 length:1551 start_codon:yes stop_codon:yes gene_type:complete